jgi:hypothetical protein
LTNGCLNAAAELVAAGDEARAGAGWVVLSSLLSLPAGWLAAKPRLAKVYAMLKAGLGGEVPEVNAKKKEAVEGQLRARAHALQVRKGRGEGVGEEEKAWEGRGGGV